MHGTPAYALTGLIAKVGLYLSHMHMVFITHAHALHASPQTPFGVRTCTKALKRLKN